MPVYKSGAKRGQRVANYKAAKTANALRAFKPTKKKGFSTGGTVGGSVGGAS